MAQFGNKRQTSLINWDTSGPSDDLHWLSWECVSYHWENTKSLSQVIQVGKELQKKVRGWGVYRGGMVCWWFDCH